LKCILPELRHQKTKPKAKRQKPDDIILPAQTENPKTEKQKQTKPQ
jgi:hypothetical protein